LNFHRETVKRLERTIMLLLQRRKGSITKKIIIFIRN